MQDISETHYSVGSTPPSMIQPTIIQLGRDWKYGGQVRSFRAWRDVSTTELMLECLRRKQGSLVEKDDISTANLFECKIVEVTLEVYEWQIL